MIADKDSSLNDFIGIRMLNTDPQKCKDICDVVVGCKAYVHVMGSNLCYPKSKTMAEANNGVTLTQTTYYERESSCDRIETELLYFEKDNQKSSNIKVRDLISIEKIDIPASKEICQKICNAYPKCIGIDYSKDDSKCDLKERIQPGDIVFATDTSKSFLLKRASPYE
ncbi:DgyrCDS14656 [Dimorphilus gyrociliatus]|uniref:DgyrCDS14656 n=1 Tax=Dimorphilus gyrociliatus TaxID=2664684 RepID=A0A7I8WEF1_9ANNE|nr:DgyrCDS14656 [Dimorphilus gyrociliatus]